MLTLVAEGPRIFTISSSDKPALAAYLTDGLQGRMVKQLTFGEDLTHPATLVYLHQVDDAAHSDTIVLDQPSEKLLRDLTMSEQRGLLSEVIISPRLILFNALGNMAPVIDKIQRELTGTKGSFDSLLAREATEGVIVAFLKNNGHDQEHTLYEEALYIPKDYLETITYLRIHAPRYLAKAFPVNAWHMVDVRMFDKYEAYDLQYQRFIQAVRALDLGYIVSENWEREVNTFTPPIGTYKIRLLTFLEPIALKKLLLGLEYSQDGSRVVDLDLFWHSKKISWTDVLNDPATKEQLSGKTLLPLAAYFASKSEKNNLIKYCVDEVNFHLTEQEKEALKALEREIRTR